MGWVSRQYSGVYIGPALILVSATIATNHPFKASVLLLAALASLLPPCLIALRFRALTDINGEEGIQFPNEQLGITGKKFKDLYNDSRAVGRSKQSQYGLSDFFWYLLAPAHAIHQEHLESADIRYKITSAVTRKLCAVDGAKLDAMATKHAESLFSKDKLGEGCWDSSRMHGHWERGIMAGRATDLFFPLFERMIFELVFGELENLSDEDNAVITKSAQNVLHGIKGTARRDTDTRRSLYLFLKEKLDGGAMAGVLDESISCEEWALFLQGVFFTTGVVQLAEGMAHVAVALAQHPQVETKLRSTLEAAEPSNDYLNKVLTEALRVWPLFGIAHRITDEDIEVEKDKQLIPKGSVLCFNYPKYHMEGFESPTQFRPERWDNLKERHTNYLPFGPPNNRPCPGKRLSQVWMRAITKVMVKRVQLHSCADHTRSMPDGGPIIMVPREGGSASMVRPAMVVMNVVLSCQSLYTSVQQVANELYMLRESKALQLAQSYFLKDYPDNDPREANKPCLSNQLYMAVH